jgi:hypothetical protein
LPFRKLSHSSIYTTKLPHGPLDKRLNMHFIKAASLLMLNAVLSAHATMFTAYRHDNCQGDAQEVNIWDNTCGDWHNDFRSVRPLAYGGGAQRITLKVGDCLGTGRRSFWADGGGNDGWTIGNCLNMEYTMSAAASFRGNT